MSTADSSRPSGLAPTMLLMVAGVWLAGTLAGCSFEHTLDEATCEQEGASSQGRVCENGFWVRRDATLPDTSLTDAAGDSDIDTGNDTGVDTDGGGCTPQNEVCNEEDDDCDMVVDEGCSCELADSIGTEGVCSDGGIIGDEGECNPPSEYVDEEGTDHCDEVDNDCDGAVDEGCDCDYATSSKGVCGKAVRDENGDCQEPDGYDDRQNEKAAGLCDGIDNNCDGTVDEMCPCSPGETRDCGKSEGLCQTGTQTCTDDGEWGQKCDGEVAPASEACDGLDNDCDGQTDEDFNRKGNSCQKGKGVCRASGTYVCTSNGMGTMCDAQPTSGSMEVCDNKDNDCDGQTDEDFNRKGNSCQKGKGVCQASGTYVCTSNGMGTMCDAQPTSGSTEVCDGKDNDCDGQTDEDFSQKGNKCRNGTGACEVQGTFVCASGGMSTTCNAMPGSPSPETCNGTDDDCDGSVDEAYKDGGDSCTGDCQCYSGRCTSNGKCAHRIFVTSQTYNGKLGGLSGADQLCQNRAGAQNLGGTWKAVLSVSGTDAKSHVAVQAPVYNLNGDEVAPDSSALWASNLTNAVIYDETTGAHRGGGALTVWTGTDVDGTWDGTDEGGDGEDCNGWTSANSNMNEVRAEVGISDGDGGDWILGAGSDGPAQGDNELYCQKQAALYCVDGQ